MVLNGHGGNDVARARLVELANQLDGLKVSWYAWWQSNSVLDLAIRRQLKTAHANWMEAFSFTRVADLPEGEKLAPEFTGLLNAAQTRQVYGDGVFGGAYQASEAIMQELFTTCLDDVLYLIESI
jgi:creatinine amidohydrolase